MSTRTRTILLTGLAAALLVGCSSETESHSKSNGEQPQSKSLPHSGAPKVDNPIDTAKYESEPCSMITEQQLSEIAIKTRLTEPDPDNTTGPSCDWVMERGSGTFGTALLTANPEGLSTLYGRNEAGEWAYFDELTIEDYPAVASSDIDNRKNGNCTVNVGIRDDLTFFVSLVAGTENPYRTKPCDLAEELAGLAVQTMKANS